MRPTLLGAALLAAHAAATLQAAAQEPVPSLPAQIPIFPLQDVTLLPSATAPFHIFEPRYREMIAGALAGDSIIGMAVLEPGHEAEYEGRPPEFAIGCAGVIVSAERLSDGRYNIVLRGLTRFRILGEDHSRAYRLAEVEGLPDVVAEGDRGRLAQRRRQVEAALRARYPRAQLPPASVTDAEAIDGLALAVPLQAAQRRELLDASGPVERAALLLGMIRGGASA